MEQVVTVGLDIAKNLFHAHGVSQDGKVVFSRKLRRAKLEAFFSTLEPCLIGIEACSTSHHWARVFTAMGHEVKLMPPAYVKRKRPLLPFRSIGISDLILCFDFDPKLASKI